ncbi:MAG: helix-turn-helix transcriptional regulator [Agathobacter sp.]|nr:helix-turn-helix transcriptional regulator [Agathobacter sp.]MBQ6812844.1 helix-turn-helix transcriptional regulator [Agathobacter sp.]
MIISEKIFELIKERGMNQKEFALATGISQSTISDWKTKHTNPAADKIMVICDVLGVTPVELLTSGQQFKSYEPEQKDTVVLSPEKKLIIERVKEMDDAQVNRLMAYVKKMK